MITFTDNKEKISREEILKNSIEKHNDIPQLILIEKGNPNAVRIKAIEEKEDLSKPFPLVFSSHDLGLKKTEATLGEEGELYALGTPEKAIKVYFEKKDNKNSLINKALNERISKASTPDELVKLTDEIADEGFKNTAQLILVNKDDKRAIRIEGLKDFKGDEVWSGDFILSSHPGRAIVRGEDAEKHDGEQVFFGETSKAMKIQIKKEGKNGVFYIKRIMQAKSKDFYLEVPRNQHDLNKAMWFRTLHSRNNDYFGWYINPDGSIRDFKNEDLVLGVGVSPDSDHWKDLSNSYGWSDYKKFPLIEENLQKELAQVDPWALFGIRLQDNDERWMEIPWNDRRSGIPLWFRTNHGGSGYFDYQLNKDGTISPSEREGLVFGIGYPNEKFRELAGYAGWNKSLKDFYEKKALIERLEALETKFGSLEKEIQELKNKK